MRLKKQVIFIIIFICSCFLFNKNIYANQQQQYYTINEFVNQKTIEQDKYFEENAQFKFINDLFTYYSFPKVNNMEEIEEYIQEVGHKIELFDMSFICRPCELLYEEDIRTIKPRVIKKLNTTTIQNMANQNYLTILCGQSNLYGTDIYIVHPTQENYQDILYTSTISSQNWYNLKTKIHTLIKTYDNLVAYYLEYPDSFEECNKKAYINTERVNVRLTPHITDDNINYTLAFSTNVQIIGENTKWYKIIHQSQIGYIYKPYLTIGTYAPPSPKPSPTVTPQPSPQNTNKVNQFINILKNQLNKPYVGGGIGPKYFDCSGLVYYAFKTMGYTYPRTNANSYARMSGWSYYTSRSNLQIGDLVFFYNDARTRIQHVGVYVGNNNIIHASSGSGKVVIASLSSNWLNKHYAWACKYSSFL